MKKKAKKLSEKEFRKNLAPPPPLDFEDEDPESEEDKKMSFLQKLINWIGITVGDEDDEEGYEDDPIISDKNK